MNYRVAYDIQQVLYPGWWIFVIGILLFSVGLGTFAFGDPKLLDSIVGRSTKQRVVMPILMCLFAVVFIGGGIINYRHFANLRDAARNGSVEIAEGKVEQFVPMPYSGHAKETFIVNGQYFSYSDYDLTQASIKLNHTVVLSKKVYK